jgi:hypothetical protein
VLFRPDALAGLRDGSIDLAFRRWKRPRVRAGGRMRTAVGVLEVVEVETVERAQLDEEDARRSGAESVAALLAELDRRGEGEIHRVRLRYAGPDPRVELRSRADLSPAELEQVRARLDRLDRASRHGPWTRATLELIRDRPEVRAGDLAEAVGRERLAFKRDVRKLKELGLTESLPVGYRLSPRGEAVFWMLLRLYS